MSSDLEVLRRERENRRKELENKVRKRKEFLENDDFEKKDENLVRDHGQLNERSDSEADSSHSRDRRRESDRERHSRPRFSRGDFSYRPNRDREQRSSSGTSRTEDFRLDPQFASSFGAAAAPSQFTPQRGVGGGRHFRGGRGRGHAHAARPHHFEADFQRHIAPKNDYSQHFVDTRQYPQNFIRDADLDERFEEYPKLKELIQLKDKQTDDFRSAPMYLKTDLKTFDLTKLGTKFDVILIDPPWEEYSRRVPGLDRPFWTFEEIKALRIDLAAENPSFIWLWCGSEEGLEQGRLLLRHWGYRRCEDICWIKTNKSQATHAVAVPETGSKQVFHRTKEHCLMGIKGTVRRSTDGHIIHANVDTDVIIAEEQPPESTRKPEELYHLIEHFAMGRRRLELFGTDHNIRQGWLTVGDEISTSVFDADRYRNFFADSVYVPSTPEIEVLRPQSPTHTPKFQTPVIGVPTLFAAPY